MHVLRGIMAAAAVASGLTSTHILAQPGAGQALGGLGGGAAQQTLSFTDLDENGDERITKKELDRARAAQRVARAQRGHSEPSADQALSFEAMDLNGDDLIDRRELGVAHQSSTGATEGDSRRSHSPQ